MSAAPLDDRSRSRGLIAVAILLIPPVLFAWFGGLAAGIVLVPGYRDSTNVAYLAFGGVLIVVSLIFATFAGTIVRAVKSPWKVRWGVVYLVGTIIPCLVGLATKLVVG